MENIELAKRYEKAHTTYIYDWLFEKSAAQLKKLAASNGTKRIETETFYFDTGILKNTPHAIKMFHYFEGRATFIKIKIENPHLIEPYTVSKICFKPFRIAPFPNVKKLDYNEGFRVPPEGITQSCFESNELSDKDCNANGCETILYNLLGYDDDYTGLKLTFNFEHFYCGFEKRLAKTVEGRFLPIDTTLPSFKAIDSACLLENKQFADFQILCGDSKFHVHKVLLAGRSPIFASMFEQPMIESIEGKMNIKDFESKPVEEFLKFLYTGAGDLENFAPEILLLADKYCVEDLKLLCENHLIKTTALESARENYRLGELGKSDKLSNRCLEILKSNKKQFLKNAEDVISFFQEFPLAYQVVFD